MNSSIITNKEECQNTNPTGLELVEFINQIKQINSKDFPQWYCNQIQ
jgi:hypothetical protein